MNKHSDVRRQPSADKQFPQRPSNSRRDPQKPSTPSITSKTREENDRQGKATDLNEKLDRSFA